jgi:hypothetical protein
MQTLPDLLAFIERTSLLRQCLIDTGRKTVCAIEQIRGARKLMGENLKVAWAEFSTLS